RFASRFLAGFARALAVFRERGLREPWWFRRRLVYPAFARSVARDENQRDHAAALATDARTARAALLATAVHFQTQRARRPPNELVTAASRTALAAIAHAF